MSPAVPFQPGIPTTIARTPFCAGPHVRYMIRRPSDARHAGGPSLHIAGPSRRVTGGSREAHAPRAAPSARAKVHAIKRRVKLRLLPAVPPSAAFRRVFTELGHFSPEPRFVNALRRQFHKRTVRAFLCARKPAIACPRRRFSTPVFPERRGFLNLKARTGVLNLGKLLFCSQKQ